LRLFALSSTISIVTTYLALRVFFRAELQGPIDPDPTRVLLSAQGRRALYGIGITGAVLITTSGFGVDLGLPTLIAAVISALAATSLNLRKLFEIGREISWSVLPLVAGLFVLVAAMNQAGASTWLGEALGHLGVMESWKGTLVASFGVAAVSNIMNNLPSGLLAGSAVQAQHVAPHLRNAVLIGVDLGPNLSVTGSLATVLWLIALRREGYHVGNFTFLKCGIVVMPIALLLSTLALLI
jgi:arsenical pump membrane protein